MKKLFHNYIINSDGRVYSLYRNRYLKGEINKFGYLIYTLHINKEPIKFPAHKLVANLFIENTKELPIINHKDGNKLNNNYTNLEWCTYYDNNKHARDLKLNDISKINSDRWKDPKFREKTSKNISDGQKKSGCFKGKKNPNFRYLILRNGIEISRNDLTKICNKSQSRIDAYIKESAKGNYIKDFDINNIKVIDTKKGQSTIERVL